MITLSRMGLAENAGKGSWRLRPNIEQVLRAMQRSADRQKTLAVHGELVSDQRLQVEVANWQKLTSVEGRVLVHGEEEQSGKSYLMLEATVGRVFYITYTREMEEVRSQGGLQQNSFIRLRKRFDSGQFRVEIEDYGSAEAVLTNHRLLREKAQEIRLRGSEPAEDGWNGWLGRYQTAIGEIEEDRSLDSTNNRLRQDRTERASSRGR